MNKIGICHYVAYNAPENAKKILAAWGMPTNNGNKEGLAQSLKALLKQEGEPVLMDLANLHPDKELIMKVEEIKAGNNSKESSSDGGSCSCNGKCSECKSSYCGCSSGFGGGSWNHNEGAFYAPNRNPMVDEFQVYGVDGSKSNEKESKKEVNKSMILFGGLSILLLYGLYKNS